eukprot:4907626-Amphidinium_carterae.1
MSFCSFWVASAVKFKTTWGTWGFEIVCRPAALLVLCDGLRNSAAATEFCARNLYTLLLPRLSARATEWEAPLQQKQQ